MGMGGLFHIAVLLTAINGQPVYQLDMTSKEGASIFTEVAACERFRTDEAFQLALNDLTKMIAAEQDQPLIAYSKCTEGAPQTRPELFT